MFSISAIHDSAEHHFRCLSPGSENWLDELAKYYLNLRSSPVVPLDKSIFEGTDFDMDGINRLIGISVVPARKAKGEKLRHLCIVRSDFGEAIAVASFEADYKTNFGWIGIRDRATAQQPGAGVDSIGIEGNAEQLTVVFLEVKVSTEAHPANPPKVVDVKDDSLRNQHLNHVQLSSEATIGKVIRAANSARDEQTRALLVMAAAYMGSSEQNRRLRIVCGNVLVRPKGLFKVQDFGTFRKTPHDFAPATIRFLVPLVDDDLEKQVDEWHTRILTCAGGAG